MLKQCSIEQVELFNQVYLKFIKNCTLLKVSRDKRSSYVLREIAAKKFTKCLKTMLK